MGCNDMTDLRTAAAQARVALSAAHGALLECSPCAAPECQQTQQEWLDEARKAVEKAVADIRAALAEPQGEPVAWLYEAKSGASFVHRGFTNVRFEADMRASKEYPEAHKMTPWFAAAPPQVQPLTIAEIEQVLGFPVMSEDGSVMVERRYVRIVRAIEAAHGIRTVEQAAADVGAEFGKVFGGIGQQETP
jgi:hypothetical protein